MAGKDIDFDVETGEELPEVNEEQENEEQEGEEQEGEEQEGEEQENEEQEGESPEDTDEEREAIRARRREERKHRKLAAREREDTLKRELASRDSIINELRNKVDGIERRNSGSELAQLDHAKQQTAQAYAYFKDQIRLASEAGNGAVVADATEKMMQAQQKFQQLTNYEQAYRQKQAAPQPLDPRLVNHAKSWMDKNSWYDPSGKDQDSRVTLTLDQQLAEEGWDPTTPEYWGELSSRVKKYLPHKAARGIVAGNKPRSVVPGSGQESRGVQSKGTYKLSSDRVHALKEAGLWDDPKQRAEAIKRFREYDKQNQG